MSAGGTPGMAVVGVVNPPVTTTDPCEYGGYCCPYGSSNETYYHHHHHHRSAAGSRSHVFPPLFYTQSISGYSGVDWTTSTNEYNHYGYHPSYSSATASTMSISSSPADFYSSSYASSTTGASSSVSPGSGPLPMTIPTSNHSSSSSSLYDSFATSCASLSQRHALYNSDTRQVQSTSSGSGQTSTSTGHFQHPPCTQSTTTSSELLSIDHGGKQFHPPEVEGEDAIEIGDESDNDDVSIASSSEDRELISVVEDEDDDENDSESTRGVRAGGKCIICQKPIEITDCSSPQLVKIIENIENGITSDDLEISVASDDIEIGGMEDVINIKDYHPSKRRNISGQMSNHPTQTQGVVTIQRLSALTKVTFALDPPPGSEQDAAILCFSCGKLVLLADCLEKQLCSTIQTLQQQFTNAHPPDENTGERVTITNELVAPSSDSNNVNPRRESFDSVDGTFLSGGKKPDDDEAHNCDSTEPSLSPKSHVPQEDKVSPTLKEATDSGSESDEEEVVSTTSDSDEESELHLFSTINNVSNEVSCSTNTSSPVVMSEVIQRSSTDDNDDTKEQNDDTSNLRTEDDSVSNAASSVSNSFNRAMEIFDDLLKGSSMFSGQVKIRAPPPPPQNSNKCERCHKGFSTKGNLNAHSQICKFKLTSISQTSSTFKKCSKCGIGFRNVLRHAKHLHEGCKPIFQCLQCPQKFLKSSEMKIHMNVHLKKKPFACEQINCNKSFATKGNLIAHSKTHSSDKAHLCVTCGKGFSRRFALTVHTYRHSGIKSYTCKVCEERFFDPANLNRHRKSVHKIHQKPVT